MNINLQPSVSTVRWYDEGCSFELRSPYRAVCSLMHLSPTAVFIFGMHGTITKADMVELFTELQRQNIETVTAERRGKLTTRSISQLLLRPNLHPAPPQAEDALE